MSETVQRNSIPTVSLYGQPLASSTLMESPHVFAIYHADNETHLNTLSAGPLPERKDGSPYTAEEWKAASREALFNLFSVLEQAKDDGEVVETLKGPKKKFDREAYRQNRSHVIEQIATLISQLETK